MASHLFSKKDSGEKQFLAESYEVCGKIVLANPRLLLDLKEFEKDQINEETIELLTPYMDQKDAFMNDDYAKNASGAVAGMLAWVAAIFLYFEKSKIVKPKQIMLMEKEGELKVA